MTTEELTAKLSVIECHLEKELNEIIKEIQCKSVSIYFYELNDETGLVTLVKPSIRVSL